MSSYIAWLNKDGKIKQKRTKDGLIIDEDEVTPLLSLFDDDED